MVWSKHQGLVWSRGQRCFGNFLRFARSQLPRAITKPVQPSKPKQQLQLHPTAKHLLRCAQALQEAGSTLKASMSRATPGVGQSPPAAAQKPRSQLPEPSKTLAPPKGPASPANRLASSNPADRPFFVCSPVDSSAPGRSTAAVLSAVVAPKNRKERRALEQGAAGPDRPRTAVFGPVRPPSWIAAPRTAPQLKQSGVVSRGAADQGSCKLPVIKPATQSLTKPVTKPVAKPVTKAKAASCDR